MTQKVRRNKRQKEKKTIDSLSFIKIKNSCASKDPKMKVKRPSANGEKNICKSYLKNLYLKHIKRPYNSIRKRQPNFKMGKRSE